MSTRTITRWRKSGAPLHSVRELKAWRAKRHRNSSAPPARADDLAALEAGLLRDALRLLAERPAAARQDNDAAPRGTCP